MKGRGEGGCREGGSRGGGYSGNKEYCDSKTGGEGGAGGRVDGIRSVGRMG